METLVLESVKHKNTLEAESEISKICFKGYFFMWERWLLYSCGSSTGR